MKKNLKRKKKIKDAKKKRSSKTSPLMKRKMPGVGNQGSQTIAGGILPGSGGFSG